MNHDYVDYLDLTARFSAEERDSGDDCVLLPEPAGKKVVDYTAVSDWWKEEKLRLMRVEAEE